MEKDKKPPTKSLTQSDINSDNKNPLQKSLTLDSKNAAKDDNIITIQIPGKMSVPTKPVLYGVNHDLKLTKTTQSEILKPTGAYEKMLIIPEEIEQRFSRTETGDIAMFERRTTGDDKSMDFRGNTTMPIELDKEPEKKQYL